MFIKMHFFSGLYIVQCFKINKTNFTLIGNKKFELIEQRCCGINKTVFSEEM